jgi:hypothetical protein
MKFLVAVPQALLSEEIEAETPEEAVRGLRDSGGFAQAINGLDINFEELLANRNPVIATVVDENAHVRRFEMEIHWRPAAPKDDVPF